MGKMIWLDDLRPMPKGFDIHVRTVEDMIEIFSTTPVDHVSLDHDLGENEKTGYDLAKWIEVEAFYGRLSKFTWHVHSANPAGAKMMTYALIRADEYWERTRNDRESDLGRTDGS